MTLSGHLSSQQSLAFIGESDTAIQLLDEGIRIIEAWNAEGDRRVVGLHLMAQGYERLLKLTRALCELHQNGHLPTSRDARRWSHGLVGLLDGTIDHLETDLNSEAAAGGDSARRSWAPAREIRRAWRRQDIEFLRSDEHWRSLIQVLDEFASGGRYHNLDVMLDGRSVTGEPLDGWSACETALFRADSRWGKLMEADPVGFSKQWYPYLAGTQVGTLQRAARALTRAWTLGSASEPGKRLTGIIGRFLFLTEDNLSICPQYRQ